MSLIRIYTTVAFGNYFFEVRMNTEEKNKNYLQIHDNSMGETVYTNREVWDTDMTKIIRILSQYQYSRLNLLQIGKKLKSRCRHLDDIDLFIHPFMVKYYDKECY